MWTTYPVTATTDTDTLGAHAEREDLRGDDPCNWTPGIGKVDDEDPHEHNSGPTGGAVFLKSTLVGSDDTRDNEVAGSHACSTGDQNLLTTNLIDEEYGRDGEQEFDDTDDSGREEGSCVSGEFHVLEDEGAVGC